MSNVGDLFHADIAAKAQAWYDRREKKVPDPFKGVAKDIVRRAYKMAGEDWRRMTVESDGSVIVWNHQVW